MPWKDITVSDEFRSMSPVDRSALKQRFFETKMLPRMRGDNLQNEEIDSLYQRFMETPDDTGEGLIRSALGSAARGFLDPLAAAPEVAGAYLGIEGLEEFGGDVRGAIEGAFPVNPAEQGLVTDTFGVLGQVGQIVATGGGGSFVGGKLIGKGATELAKKQAEKFGARAAVQTAMGSSAVAGGLERAEQLGLEGGDRLLRGAIAGGTELLAERLGGFATELGGVGKAFGFGSDTIESGFMQPIIRGMVTEIPEEMGVETAGQLTDIAMAPETAPAFDFGQTAYAGLLGAVGGVAFGGIEAAITPRTKKAFDGTTDFIPSSTPPPGMTVEEAEEQDLLKYGNAGEIIGYVLPVSDETIDTNVEPLVENVAATPEASATAAALQRIALGDTESGLTDAGMADATANLLTGIPMQKPLGGELVAEDAMLEGQPIEEDQAAPEQQQPTETNVPLTQETLQQEQGRGQELQEPRELPILPAEPTAQAPEAAVGAEAAVDTQAALDTQGDGIVRDEGIVGADVELEQQKATLPVDVEGAMLQGGDVRQEETQQVSAAADVPTESLPATGQPTSGDVGVAGESDLAALEQLRNKSNRAPYQPVSEDQQKRLKLLGLITGKSKLTDSGETQLADYLSLRKSNDTKDALSFDDRQEELIQDIEAGRPISKSDAEKFFSPESAWLERAIISTNATPPPQAQPQPATPATQETQPQAAASTEVTATQESTAAQPAAGETGDAGVARPRGAAAIDPAKRATFESLPKENKTNLAVNIRRFGWNPEDQGVTLAEYNELIAPVLAKEEAKKAEEKREAERIVENRNAANSAPPVISVVTKQELDEPFDGDDGYFYHITTPAGSKKILAQQSIGTGFKQSMSSGYWAEYSRGKAFLTDRKGVSYWIGKIEDHLESQERSPKTVVLRVPKYAVTGLNVDVEGTRDANAPAWFSTEAIKPNKNAAPISNQVPSGLQSTQAKGASANNIGQEASQQSETNEAQETDIPAGRSESANAAINRGLPDDSQQDIRSASTVQQRLQSYISTLSPKAQAAWTPERLEAAQSYYTTGNESALEPLTATQRKIVMREGVSESDAAAYEAEQKRQFALRNPQAADDAEKLLNRLKELNDNATRISQAEPRDVSGGDTGETTGTQDVSSARAKAVQAGVAGLDWANMGAEQRRKALLDFATKTARSLQDNSVRLRGASRIIQDQKSRAFAEYAGDGRSFSVTINISADTSVNEKLADPTPAFSQIYKVVEEEFIHAIQLQDAFARWGAVGSPGKFNDWFIADSVKNINDLFQLADNLSSTGNIEAAERIYEVIYTAAAQYEGGDPQDLLDTLDSFPGDAHSLYLEMARMLSQIQLDDFTSETEFVRFFRAVEEWINKALSIMRDAAKLVKTGALGEALKRDVAAITSAMREMRESIALLEAAEKQPPAATEQELLENPNALVDSLSDETLQQERESREEALDETPRYKKILRSADGSIRRTGVKSTPARAARNSYIGVIPGVENTWLGTVEEFDAEFPDGYPFDSKTTTPPADTEALVAADGRPFIFLDRVTVLDGDAERAEQHGTSPGVEAVKRLLRHESFIHRGYMALPGPLKNRFADFVASGIIPPEDLDFLVNNGYPHYKGWRDSKSTEMLAAEEWLAQRVERMGRIPQSGPIASIMDWLRDVWRWLTGGETTDLDKLRNTMRAMHKALGALDPKQRIVMELPDMDVLRRSYIGERAIENMPEERKQFMRDSLDTAKAMAAAGKSSEEIRAVTGWFQGIGRGNEKLRWELPDDDAALRLDEYRAAREEGDSAREIVSRFYADKKQRDMEEAQAAVVGKPMEFIRELSKKLKASQQSDAEMLQSFYAGEENPNRVNNRVPLGYILDHPQLFEMYPELKAVPVSFNAADASADATEDGSFNPSTGILFLSPLGFSQKNKTLSTALHEIQHWIQGKEDFARGGNAEAMRKMNDFIGLAVNQSKLAKVLRDAADLQDSVGGFSNDVVSNLPQDQISIAFGAYNTIEDRWIPSDELRNEADKLDKRILDTDFTGYEAYRRLAGEIEARDIQARQRFTPAQRAATAPYSSENIAPEDAIVMFGGSGSQASTSSDIRYSKVQRPDPILNQPSRLRGNVPEITKPNAQRRSIYETVEGFEGAVEVIPRQYFPMGSKEKGNEFSATEALLSWSKDLLKPYAEDIGGLVEFLAILRSDERLQNELKLGPRSGAVVMPFLAQEAANRAEALGSRDMRNAFLMEYDALASAGGQNLWAFKAASLHPDFATNRYTAMMDKTEEQNFATTVDKKINKSRTIQDVVSNLPEAGEVAADNVSDGLADEKQISDKVLELGAAVQGNPTLTERIKKLISNVIDRGRKLRALQKLRGELRESVIPDSGNINSMSEAELEAEIARLTAEISADMDFIEKEVAKKPTEKPTKGPKTPIETAKEIINKITTAAAKVSAKKKQPDAVRSLYRKHLKKPMSEAEFSAEAKAAGLDAATAKGLYDAINLEIVAIEIQAQAKAAERAQTKELKKAEREAEKYQNQAEAKINEVADALADPSLTQDKEKVVNPLTEIYQNQIKTPITEPQFVEQVVALGVDEETATLLFSIAAMDRQARIDIRVAREDLRRREMSEAQASKLIYAQEEELRQGSKDREPSKSGDSINKAFREQVVNPLSQEKFRERLDKLKVSQKLADRLYATAERVATDNERAEVYRKRVALLDVDSAALTRFVNDLRLKGKLTGEPIQWRDLLSLPVAHQDTVKAELLARVKRHEALRNLSTGEQQAIADALNTIWQRERRKVFQAMIKKADLMGVSKEDQEVIVEAMPALLKYINQGMLGTSAFYRAVGEKFGIAPISAEARKQVEEMAAKMQEKELYSFERAVLAEKILKILQNNSQLSRAEILSSWWVNSVLTGGRTIFDMALGVLSGGFSIAKKMITATIETRSPKAAIDGLSVFGDGLWAGAQVALKNLFRPEEGLLASRNPAVADYFDKGAIGAGLTTGDKLLIQKGDKPKDKLKRGLGVWMSFFERLFAGLDHITSTATMHGTMRMAAAMNPKMFSDALIPTKQDYANAMERAKLRLPGGSKAAQIRLSQSIIEDGQHILERGLDESFMSQWRQLVADSRAEGNTASYQEEPTGAGGLIYGLVRKATSGLEDKTKGYRDEARISLTEARKTGRGVASSAVNYFVASLGYFLGTQAQNLLGVRFMRFTGNKLNELISFIPIVGMARLQEKGMVSGENYTLRGQNVRANQVLGWMSAVIYLILLNDLDEEDEERGWIVNGSWDNLTPERKSQQMAVGLKPNTYSKFNKETGRWTSYNFVSWPFAGWMAAFGSVSDYKRLTPEKWNEKVLADKMMAAAYAGAFALKDISSLSSLTEMFGTSSDTTDPAEAAQKRFVKGASNFAGGFIPKTFKDVDAWFDETNYKPQDTFEHFAKEVPFYRRSIGEPLRDIFYEKVQVSRTPWSRAIQISPDDPAYRILGRLNSNGIWITPANPSNRKVKRGGKLRDMTDEESNAYMAEVGKRYKEFVMKQGDRLLEMDVDRAEELVSKYTARIREIAFKRAIATVGKAAIPSPE